MVTHLTNVYYRLRIQYLDLTYKTNTTYPRMVTHLKEVYYRLRI